ncbi:MAG: sigma-70 family RNA polymerase sigma factor [Gemmatimonadaceae bacterium]|nr:sigma-70 family RNA polymerase sigma factor [Gemmatimonadaceae bacterium]
MAQPESSATPGDVTQLLAAARGGDAGALDALFPLVYAELHRAAELLLNREAQGHTLQATALVHEAYLKMSRGGAPDAEGTAHFLGIAARAMRQILVDHARRRKTAKRGRGEVFVTLGDHAAADAPEADAEQLVALDEALTELAKMDDRLGRVVELRFFGGLTEEQTAAALGVTSRTVQRDWAKARAWLHARIAQDI